MANVAAVSLSLVVLAGAARALPQEKDARLVPALKEADLKTLNEAAQDWVEAELRWDEDSKYRSKRDKARAKFMDTLEKKSPKVDALANVGNLLAIFANVFPYKRISTSGEIKRVKGEVPYTVLEPKPYKETAPYPAILVLPQLDSDRSKWVDSKEYLGNTWKKSTLAKAMFAVVPELRKGDDYDAAADLSTEKGRTDEEARIRSVLSAFGEAQRTYHLDREKLFLDCGAGTSGFGLRLVTYFPSRFAGVILRRPVDPGELLLDSLIGLPVFMVTDQKTKDVGNKLKAALDKLNGGEASLVTLLEDESPTGEKAGPVLDAWVAKTKRRLFPLHVKIAPNHDFFRKAFWVEVIRCEPLDAVKKDERPTLDVTVNREKNQIILKTRSVSEVGFYLNDYIVDLDKEVTFVVDGKELKGNKFQRNVSYLYEYMKRFYDPTALYTAWYRFELPKGEGK